MPRFAWLPFATRKTRTPAARRRRLEAAFFWTAVVYNFCHPHASLLATPAMAADPDSVWSIDQLYITDLNVSSSTLFCGAAD
ncbi:MAG: hypothetical protein R3E79_16040 [Caldilineaceae bacterium]